MANPNPTRSSLKPGAPSAKRAVFCRRYNLCLDAVVVEGWDDWSCSACSFYAESHAPSATDLANSRPRNPIIE